MAVNLTALLTEVTDVARNSTTGALDNNKRTRAFNRVLLDLQDYADWDFTKRTKTFYFIDGVNEYSLENFVGCTCQDNDGSTSINDFKNPYDLRTIDANSPFKYKEVKDVRYDIRYNRTAYKYGVDNDTLVVNFPRQVSAQLHNCDSLTANGTWTASGDATNLTADSVGYKEGSASLNFDVSAGTSLILTNSTLSSKNLTQLQNKSHFVLWVYLPTTTNFTSVGLRFGSSASAYWEKVETLPAGSNALVVGWNRFAFRWADATQTGSPDVTAMNYLRVALTYSASTTDTDFRIDDIRVGQETEMELEYYSKAMVQDVAGDHQLEFNASAVTGTDTLLGDTDARRTLIKGAEMELFHIIGGKSQRDLDNARNDYEKKKVDLLKKSGHRLRKPAKTLNFPGRRGR